jgi:hypothetical protein
MSTAPPLLGFETHSVSRGPATRPLLPMSEAFAVSRRPVQPLAIVDIRATPQPCMADMFRFMASSVSRSSRVGLNMASSESALCAGECPGGT